ncbi:MAG: hypothetical protein R1F54_04220 [Candidatus Zeuxoniibacter abyssi]|nr:MAG: hypothetical protein R1F54_04220 [Candidatus Persebacteraceae bacterium AB1(2)]
MSTVYTTITPDESLSAEKQQAELGEVQRKYYETHARCERLLVETEQKHNETYTRYDELLSTTEQKHNEDHARYDQLLGETEQKHNEINKLHNELLGNPNEENGESISKNINDLLDTIKVAKDNADEQIAAIKKQSEKGKEITDNLHRQIKSLLPGATSAGLAKSYKENKLEIWERRFLWAGFVASLIILIGIYFELLSSNVTDINTILTRIAVGFPLIWVAWYCQRTLSERQKIKEEYKHKQKMMLLYEGFMKQIQALGEDDKALQKKMVGIMLDAIKKNPAEFIGTPDTIIDSRAKAIANKIPISSSPNKKDTI